MYSVVGCGDCRSVWIVEAEPETTTCPRCGKRHRFDALRTLARSDDKRAVRQARAAILAERADSTETGDLPDFDEMARAVDDDAARISAGTQASGGTSQEAIVRRAIRTLETPTGDEIVAFSAEHGVPESAVRDLIEGLVRSGDLTETDDGYRLL